MVYYYPCFRWRIRDRSRSGISQALKSILQSSTSTQPSFPRFPQAGFYVIGGSQSLRRRTSRLPLWQYPYAYFIRKCRTLQAVFRLFSFSTCYPVTVHSVPVTGKNPCKICFANGFLLATATFSHGLSSKC